MNMAIGQSSILPLHRAARHGYTKIVAMLINEVEPQARGRVLDTQTEFGYTALHWCAAYGGADGDGVHAAVAEELVTAGADTSLCNTRGQTP